jgi:DNA-binding NarL/FixJ family response regulator
MAGILVVDDHPLVRRNVRGVLEEEGYEVCGEAATGREAVEMAPILKPDLVVLDLSMPELNGLEAARLILRDTPEIRVLILTMHDEEVMTREALASGAASCVMKCNVQQFIGEVHRLLRPNHYHSETQQDQSELPIDDDTIARNASATDRERKADAGSMHVLRVARVFFRPIR